MIISIPLALGISAVLKYLTGHGALYWIYYSWTYLYLWLDKYRKKSRFDLYDYSDDDNPERKAFFVPHQEWELDGPTEISEYREGKSDDVFCFGVNKSNECLAISVSRIPNEKRVKCSLLLRLSNGQTFTIPEEHAFQTEDGESYTFGSQRLKIQCLLPMRKWRIFFNGILREIPSEDDNSPPKYKHVRFTFVWTASSDIFDFQRDLSKKDLPRIVAESSSWSCLPAKYLKKLRKIFDSYEQSGMIHGTITVEGEEERIMYLWGARQRSRGSLKELQTGTITDYYGNFTDGALIHLGILNSPELGQNKFTYGYVMRSDGFTFPVENCVERIHSANDRSFSFLCHNRQYNFSVRKTEFEAIKFEKEFKGDMFAKFAEMHLGEKKGFGIIVSGSLKQFEKGQIQTKNIPSQRSSSHDSQLCVTFEDATCQDSDLTGGKGSSLGKLCSLQKQGKKSGSKIITFEVPKGVVVTTKAYQKFTKGCLESELEEFQKQFWISDSGGADLCKNVMKKVIEFQIPENVKNSIKTNMISVFGSNFDKMKFAVRSSATGEDTAQMSAAGQMETFLGVVGFDEILEAVKKCWASQFSHQAVEYKKHYGQILNSPMAVVIQQMVPCDVAGVIFTCDPVNGDPRHISVTGNFGLGESVVSAAAEPDTFLLRRDIKNRLEIKEKNPGKKSTKIIMDGDHGTKEVETGSESEMLCLSDEAVLKLGEIAIQVEEYFGNARDIEWGVVGETVYLFQSRPVTSLDGETEYETKHIFDTYVRTDSEYLTKGNIGEVMPGATSPLGYNMMEKSLEASTQRPRILRWQFNNIPEVPYFESLFISHASQAFFNIIDGFLTMPESEKELKTSMLVSFFGRVIDDSEMEPIAHERHIIHNKRTKIDSLKMQLYTFVCMFLAGQTNKRLAKMIEKFHFPYKSPKTAEELLHLIGLKCHIMAEGVHGNSDCIMASSFWNHCLLTVLSKAHGSFDNIVFGDFAYLLSSCQKVESADVPSSLEKLACTISQNIDPEEFKKMDEKEALEWLRRSKSEAGIEFKNFLNKHGHRCLKEFDVRSLPWGDEPILLIKMLQSLVTATKKKQSAKSEPHSTSTLLSNMKVQLKGISKLLMYIILPNCRRGVRDRETGKSVLIRSVNKLRQPFHRLAKLMVEEGRLPTQDLIFFLCVEEINQLIKTRSPRIVTRALKRQKLHPQLDKLIYPEICCGPPQPVNLEKVYIPTGTELVMTGVPVSQGVVKATARVVLNLDEASLIQPGDVLITYCTDIGWSPYFTLLSGVVTELGGLISHGAVVAREYGLPCVVGLHGATRAFKSGDTVILDGTKGTLRRVENS